MSLYREGKEGKQKNTLDNVEQNNRSTMVTQVPLSTRFERKLKYMKRSDPTIVFECCI